MSGSQVSLPSRFLPPKPLSPPPLPLRLISSPTHLLSPLLLVFPLIHSPSQPPHCPALTFPFKYIFSRVPLSFCPALPSHSLPATPPPVSSCLPCHCSPSLPFPRSPALLPSPFLPASSLTTPLLPLSAVALTPASAYATQHSVTCIYAPPRLLHSPIPCFP